MVEERARWCAPLLLVNGSRAFGLLLKNPSNGQVVLIAHHVDGFNFTDFTTAAWQ
jgi:hypothetical protein